MAEISHRESMQAHQFGLARGAAEWHPDCVKISICSGALLLAAAALPAQDVKPFDIKVGLWETSTTTEMSGMAMPNMPQIPPEALARMPPEQRARIEAMMKGRGGSPNAMTVKSCMTKESLDRGALFNQQDKSCTMKVVSSTPSKQVMHMDCTRDNNHMTGDMTVERVDAEHAKGNMVMKSEGEHAMNMKMSFQTKWLSADCGDVKPVSPK